MDNFVEHMVQDNEEKPKNSSSRKLHAGNSNVIISAHYREGLKENTIYTSTLQIFTVIKHSNAIFVTVAWLTNPKQA